MDWITISGLKPYDGRYELDINQQPLTTREWGWAKRYAGYLPVNLDQETFTGPEMIAGLAIVALGRNSKIEATEGAARGERLQDAPFGATVGWEAGPPKMRVMPALLRTGPPRARASMATIRAALRRPWCCARNLLAALPRLLRGPPRRRR